jgi:hypothetical protein
MTTRIAHHFFNDTATTETLAGRLCRWACQWLTALLIGAAAHVLLQPWLGSVAALAIAGLLATASLLLITPGLWSTLDPRGTWRLDEQGIAFTPVDGRVRSLGWTAIEQVAWGPWSIRIAGGGRRLLITSGWLAPAAWSSIRAELSSRLAYRFEVERELPPASWWDACTRSTRLQRLLGMTAMTALCVTAAMIQVSTGGRWPVFMLILVIAVRLSTAVVNSRRRPLQRRELPGSALPEAA